MHLPQCQRLKELNIYVRETATQHVRRAHETRGPRRYLGRITQDQPNYRETRSLYNLQGIDYILCLRGLQRVAFFDYDWWLTKGKKKVPVRDSGFMEALRSAVLQNKPIKKIHSVETSTTRTATPSIRTT